MDKIDVDAREMDELVRNLRELQKSGFMREVRQVVSKGCLHIKQDWKQRWEGHAHIPRLPRSISYDVVSRHVSVHGEIGPDKGREKFQGPLGNIIEYGTINNAPIPGGVPALELEQPKFAKALADLGEKAPLDRGAR